MRSLRTVRMPVALALALLSAFAFEARASDVAIKSWRYPVLSEPELGSAPHVLGPGGATRLRVILDQTGPEPLFGAIRTMSAGAFACTVLVNPPGCGTPTSITIQAAQPADDDTATVNWSSACALPGDCVTVKFNSTKGPIAVRRSYWANAAGDSIVYTLPCGRLPGASPPGMGALVALIALAGAWVTVRSRRSVRT